MWLIVRAPQFGPTGVVSRDLVDMTDVVLTIVNLAELKHPAPLNLCPLTPSLRGSADPFEKRNWIFAATTKVQMIRDWQHILDSQGNFHDLLKDPCQQEEVSPLDKTAPGRRQRLQRILDRLNGLPVDASPEPQLL